MRLKGEQPEDIIAATGLAKMTVYDLLNDARATRRDKLEVMAKHFGKKLGQIEAMRGTEPAGMATLFVDPAVAQEFVRFADGERLSHSDALRQLLKRNAGAAD